MKTRKILALALALLLALGCCSVALADDVYTITYAIPGQGEYATRTVTAGEPLGTTMPEAPVVDGKTFVRWFRMEGGTRVTVDASYVPTGDMTILAEMEDAPAAKTYTITYAIYGQSGEYTRQTVTAGDALGTLPAGPTVAGKVFVRWFRMDGANRVTVDASYVPAGDMTILAEMEDAPAAKTYTITYAIYGQSGEYTRQTVTAGDALGTLPAGPTVAGKVFVRWFRMDGANRVTVDASYVPAGDMTILAEMADAPQQLTASITQQPRDAIVTEGEKAVFTITAVSEPAGTALQYQWYRSTDDGKTFTAISGATAATYTSSATTLANDGYQYKCVVTPQGQGAQQVESAIAKLFVQSSSDPGSVVPETGDSPALYIFMAVFGICAICLASSPLLKRRNG